MLLFFCLLERHQLHETFWTHLSLKLSLSFSWSAFYHICILLSCVLAIYNLIPISVTIFSSFLSLIWLYFFLSSVPFCSVFYLSEGVFLTFYLQILVLRCFISSEYHYVNFLLPHIFLFLGIRRAIHQLQSLWFTLFLLMEVLNGCDLLFSISIHFMVRVPSSRTPSFFFWKIIFSSSSSFLSMTLKSYVFISSLWSTIISGYQYWYCLLFSSSLWLELWTIRYQTCVFFFLMFAKIYKKNFLVKKKKKGIKV